MNESMFSSVKCPVIALILIKRKLNQSAQVQQLCFSSKKKRTNKNNPFQLTTSTCYCPETLAVLVETVGSRDTNQCGQSWTQLLSAYSPRPSLPSWPSGRDVFHVDLLFSQLLKWMKSNYWCERFQCTLSLCSSWLVDSLLLLLLLLLSSSRERLNQSPSIQSNHWINGDSMVRLPSMVVGSISTTLALLPPIHTGRVCRA